jgi:Cu/Ag efflux protein CusF
MVRQLLAALPIAQFATKMRRRVTSEGSQSMFHAHTSHGAGWARFLLYLHGRANVMKFNEMSNALSMVIVLLPIICSGASAAAGIETTAAMADVRQENTSVRTSEATGRVETIDRASRVITVVTPKRVVQQIFVPAEVGAFETLKVGDEVAVRYTDSTIVRVNPAAKRARLSDTTAQAREEAQKEGTGSHGVQQLTLVVVIDEINRQTGEVLYRTADDMFGLQVVRDPKLLEGIKPGDTVEIVYTRARAVSVTPAGKR